MNAGKLRSIENDSIFIDSNKHTRIVGFRTTKRCHNSKKIRSIQPIYYSVNEDICKNQLVQLSKGALQEIESYGPECGELTNILMM